MVLPTEELQFVTFFFFEKNTSKKVISLKAKRRLHNRHVKHSPKFFCDSLYVLHYFSSELNGRTNIKLWIVFKRKHKKLKLTK